MSDELPGCCGWLRWSHHFPPDTNVNTNNSSSSRKAVRFYLTWFYLETINQAELSEFSVVFNKDQTLRKIDV